jgi:hypothetical protein
MAMMAQAALKLLRGEEELLHHDQQSQRQQLTHDEGDVLEAGIETTVFRGSDFAQVGC